MQLDKLEILKDLFYGFGRDPHANKGIFDHYLSKSSDADPWVLRKAVDELLASSQSLPRVNGLLNAIKRYTPERTVYNSDCPLCGTTGLIYNVFCFKPESGGRMEVMGMSHKVVSGATYRSEIIGRCRCLNGEEHALSSHHTLSTPVDPPSYLINPAKDAGWDCAFQSSVIAKKLNRVAKNLSQEPNVITKANSFQTSVAPLVDTLNSLGLNTFVIDSPEAVDKLPKDLFKNNDQD